MPSGEANRRTYWVLHALKLIRQELLSEEDLSELNESQAKELIGEISRRKEAREREAKAAEEAAQQAKREAQQARDAAERDAAEKRQRYEQSRAENVRKASQQETRRIVTSVGSQLREGKIGTREVRQKAAEILPPPFKEKSAPDIKKLARQLASDIDGVFAKADLRRQKLCEIAQYRQYLDPISKDLLIGSLGDLLTRIQELVEALNQPITNGAGRSAKSVTPKQLK